MISKIIVLLSLIFVSVCGKRVSQEQQFAIASQTFHHRDLPMQYLKHNKIQKRRFEEQPEYGHTIYRKHSLSPIKLPSIQYAPLAQELKPKEHQERQYERTVIERHRTASSPVPVNLEKVRTIYATNIQENKKTYHLEPRLISEEYNFKKKYNTGYNVDVPTNSYSTQVESFKKTFIPPQQNYHKQQIKPSKFVYYQTKAKKSLEPYLTNEEQKDDEVEQSTSENYYNEHVNGYIISTEYSAPTRMEPRLHPKTYSLHNQLDMEKPAQTFQNQRIHLNIGRIYNIGKQPQEDHFPAILNMPKNHIPKASAHLKQIVFVPHIDTPEKTIMYPIIRSRHEHHPSKNSVFKA